MLMAKKYKCPIAQYFLAQAYEKGTHIEKILLEACSYYLLTIKNKISSPSLIKKATRHLDSLFKQNPDLRESFKQKFPDSGLDFDNSPDKLPVLEEKPPKRVENIEIELGELIFMDDKPSETKAISSPAASSTSSTTTSPIIAGNYLGFFQFRSPIEGDKGELLGVKLEELGSGSPSLSRGGEKDED